MFKTLRGYVIHRNDVSVFTAYNAEDKPCFFGASYLDIVRMIIGASK